MSDTEQTAEYEADSVDGQDYEDDLDEIDSDETDLDAEEGDEDDSEEVDYEGKQYKLPKEIKDALLRQADYTRKTQEVAETRRAVQAQAAELNEQRMFQEAAMQHVGKIVQVEETLNRYASVNWQQLAANDPAAAQQHWIAYQQAKEQKGQLAGQLQDMQQMLHQRTASVRQEHIEAGIAQLQRDIPDFHKVVPALVEYGVKALGFDPDELRTEMDPRRVKALHKAYLYDKLVAGKGKPVRQTESQTPVSSIKARTGGTGRVDLVKDAGKMSADEWAKRRNAQIRAKNARGR